MERHNASSDERVRLSLLAVDSHGYTYPTMAIAKLLGFDPCPRLRDLAERKPFVPRGLKATSSGSSRSPPPLMIFFERLYPIARH